MQTVCVAKGVGEYTSRPQPEDLVPPEELSICFGGGDFLSIGRSLVERLCSWGELLPSERVLDVGCGVGRAAVALTQYLSSNGSYVGMDTYPFGIAWAKEHITPYFPNFSFQTVDVFNNLYNPTATVRASEFVFPYEDASYDLALLNSVFTHMMPEDVLGYLSQIYRVLDQDARLYCTWFLMSDETQEVLENNPDTAIRLEHGFGSFYVDNPKDPEEAVGYDENFVRNMLEQQGFIIESLRPGNWCGRGSENYQDVIVARKP